MRTFYVYIMTNDWNTVLYTGVTNDLSSRVLQHKRREVSGFTQRYHVTKLIYYEEFQYVYDAIEREKQLKGWLRRKKDELIASMNPRWKDISDGWYSKEEMLV
ncbi:MAG: GIY-YIG nuclease family protein [Candidatus Kerfeldbacteria bacterium]|nr:GIY-YIG nuclease family protein [Candidatus Kerfeldbacteria bacterium]